MAKKKVNPATAEGMETSASLTPIVETPTPAVVEDAAPPLTGSITDLVNYAADRYGLVQTLWRRTVVQFWLMGRAFAEIEDRFATANKGKTKRDPSWLSFEKAVAATPVSENTARRAADVAKAFPDPAELEGLTIKEAVEIARSLPAPPPTAAEKFARLQEQRAKAAEDVKDIDRLLATSKTKTKDDKPDADPKPNPDPDPEPPPPPDDTADVEYIETVDKVVEALDHLVADAPRVRTRRPTKEKLLKALADVQFLLKHFGVVA